jgi:hypothetical protein
MEILLKLLVAAAYAAIIFALVGSFIWGVLHFPIVSIFMFLTFVIFLFIVDA